MLQMHHYQIMLTKDFLNTNEVRGERVLLEISPATICIVVSLKRARFTPISGNGIGSSVHLFTIPDGQVTTTGSSSSDGLL